MSFGERLDQALAQSGKTRQELATHLGITPGAISLLITGKSAQMKTDHCAKTAKFLRCNWYWLATGEGSQDDEEQSWRDVARSLATTKDIAERGQKYGQFCLEVDRMVDLGRSARREQGSGPAVPPANDRRDKRTKLKPDH